MARRSKSIRPYEDYRVQTDPCVNPDDGIYSGPSKRVAVSDGTFAPVQDKPGQNQDKDRGL